MIQADAIPDWFVWAGLLIVLAMILGSVGVVAFCISRKNRKQNLVPEEKKEQENRPTRTNKPNEA